MRAAGKAPAADAAARTKDRPAVPLREPNVVVRVRPLAADGPHSASSTPVYKRLAKWDDNQVVLEDCVDLGNGFSRKDGDGLQRPQVYTFASAVLGTDVKQEDVYAAAASSMVHSFVNDGYNGLLFTYGQTGTGKTHTIFGPESSWADITHEQAGLFPRAVAAVLEAMGSRSATTAFVLSAQAMEFYMCQCTDLMDDSMPCMIGDDHAPIGLLSFPLAQPSDVVAFMARARRNRTSRSTLMNQAGGGHEGSSRSHCVLILTLRQLDLSSCRCLTTRLHVMDMAGAERPKSTGSDHADAIAAVMKYWRDPLGEISVGGQGYIVNYELHQLRTAVIQATEQHKKRKQLVNSKDLGTSFVEYCRACFAGQSLLSMIVTLSPAPACGWETWFSCTYGDDLSKLRAPIVPQRYVPMAKVLKEAEAAAAASAADLAKTPSSGPAAKYLPRRTVQARHAARELELCQRLRALAPA